MQQTDHNASVSNCLYIAVEHNVFYKGMEVASILELVWLLEWIECGAS
jgi:hypothetical protein